MRDSTYTTHCDNGFIMIR